ECPPFDLFDAVGSRIFIVSKGVLFLYATLKLFLNSPAQPGVFVNKKKRLLKEWSFSFWLLKI
ncbi:MAG: hypothetical protein IJW86_08730, partial [Clostridia bacterium]|nr:hypothetical protein [Clostridia bacterium]